MLENMKDSNLFYFLGMCVVVVGNILGNYFLKKGGVALQEQYFYFQFLNIYFIVGVCCFSMSIILYAFVLSVLPLYQAQALASLQFLGSVLVGKYFFLEKISSLQFMGIILICAGIVLVLFRA